MSDSPANRPPMLPPMPVSSPKPPTSIPTGPSPDRKEMTAGWNDPPKIIQKSDSNNPLRREKKNKKSNLAAPPTMPMFSPEK